jgi:hypothetical protein
MPKNDPHASHNHNSLAFTLREMDRGRFGERRKINPLKAGQQQQQ